MDERQSPTAVSKPGDHIDFRIAELLYEGRLTLPQIAQEVGVSRATVCRRMKKPVVQRLMQRAQEAEVTRATMYLATYAPAMAAKLITTMVSGEMNERDRCEMLIQTLDRILKLMPQAAPLVQVLQQNANVNQAERHPMPLHLDAETAAAMEAAERTFIQALERAKPIQHDAATPPRIIEPEEFAQDPAYQEVAHEGPTEAAEPPPGGPAGEGLHEVPPVAEDLRPLETPAVQPENLPPQPTVGLPARPVGGRRRAVKIRGRRR